MKQSKETERNGTEDGGNVLFFNRVDREDHSGKVTFEQTST